MDLSKVGKFCTIKGTAWMLTDRLLGACWKIFNNKSCWNFGNVHKIAFCTAVQNLSQIGQPWFFTFSWGPPFANLLIFLHWHFMIKRLKFKGGTPWKSEKSRLSDLTQILHSCTKCNFMHIAKISATFIIENFTTSTNNPSVNIQAVPFCCLKKSSKYLKKIPI